MVTKKKPELTELYYFVRGGTTDRSHPNSLEWFNFVEISLDACKIVLRRAAENERDSRTFASLLNHPIKDGRSDEKRITPKEVAETLPTALFINDALLVLMDTFYRKEPQAEQRGKYDPPLINENVVACKVLASSEMFGMTKAGFEETIMPYFEDLEMGLGEYIIDRFLDSAVNELKKAKAKVVEEELAMKPCLDIRTRLGIHNLL